MNRMLKLNRETLMALQAAELSAVIGGGFNDSELPPTLVSCGATQCVANCANIQSGMAACPTGHSIVRNHV